MAEAMVDVRERRIALRHIELAAKCWGDPDLPPLLAVHGWLDNAASFDLVAPLLAVRRHVVAVDLAGHGRSAHRAPGQWYAFVDYLDEIGELVMQLGGHVDLLGHSLGAALVSVYASLAPQGVGRLALVEGLGPLTLEPAEAHAQLRRAFEARMAFEGRLRVFADLGAAVAARVRAGGLTMEAARMLVTRGTHAVDGGFTWSSDPRLTLPSAQRYSEEQLAPMLAAIKAPTLLVLAEPGAPYLPRESLEQRIARVDDIEVVRMSGSHHLHMDHPGEVAACVAAFLDRPLP
ncbi:MAG TPA: alpha/beta hydrolase [Dokdonella sp.]|uniref:alpha/beta fold hydrolase n=1 Tax=Dokdonella sp. TaxID=2291710 RepID=UPI0025BE963F|nr:alpha/beta hydrolase [Dokdonella sp.]MBX3691126.1 alpha/beta fold hydrolase [Dokdonella sp.]HNR91942.1 alpha/beta hydrolase [Dokdonella sp.]